MLRMVDTLILDQLLDRRDTSPPVEAFEMTAMHGHEGVLQKLFNATKRASLDFDTMNHIVAHVILTLARNGFSTALAWVIPQFQQALGLMEILKRFIAYTGATACGESLVQLRP